MKYGCFITYAIASWSAYPLDKLFSYYEEMHCIVVCIFMILLQDHLHGPFIV